MVKMDGCDWPREFNLLYTLQYTLYMVLYRPSSIIPSGKKGRVENLYLAYLFFQCTSNLELHFFNFGLMPSFPT